MEEGKKREREWKENFLKQTSSFHNFTKTRFPYAHVSVGKSGAQFTMQGWLT